MNWYLLYKESANVRVNLDDLKKKGPRDVDGYNNFITEFNRRKKFVQEYGWSVPSEEAIKKIKSFISGEKVLEVVSGFGMWAKLLQDAGIHMTPTDNFSSHYTDTAKKDKYKKFTDVENLKYDKAIEKYSDHTVLFMSWPPYEDPMAYRALKAFTGNKVIYIGEGHGGATGSDAFHELLSDEFNLIEIVNLPTWNGIHDNIYLYERK